MQTRCYSLKLTGASAIAASTLHIELNDDGYRYPQTECDSTSQNSIPIPFATIPIARNNRMSIIACTDKFVNVLANDLNVAGATLNIIKNSSRGSSAAAAPMIIYNTGILADCMTNGGKRDTLRYRVCQGGNCAEADLFIEILRRPSVKLHDSCSRKPYLGIDYQYHAAAYQWYTSSDKLNWTPVSGATGLKLYVTDEAWYKVAVTFNGDAFETIPAHFIINRKYRMQGTLFWYDSTLQY